MCTYEHLVEVTLAHGLIPLVVPQLRTITLGGAVTGLGIESTSFRSGLPHESVLEMDVLTGAGEVVTTRPGDDLFDAFPNSYGSLGYATRLRIELERVSPYVALRHVRVEDHLLPRRGGGRSSPAGELGRRAGRRARRRRVRARGGLPDAGPLDRRARPDQRLRRAGDLLPLDPAAADRPADDARLPLALGHRLVLVLACLRRPAPRRTPHLAPTPAPLRRLHEARRARPQVGDRRPARPAGRPTAGRAGRPGRRGPGRAAARVPRLVRRRDRHAPGVAVPAAPAPYDPGPTLADLPADGRARPTSTSASGATSPSGPRRRPHRATGRSRRRCTSWAATSRSTPRRSTTATRSTRSTTAPTSQR